MDMNVHKFLRMIALFNHESSLMNASLTRNLAAFAECFRLGDAQVKRVRKSVRSVKSVGDKENTPCASFFRINSSHQILFISHRINRLHRRQVAAPLLPSGKSVKSVRSVGNINNILCANSQKLTAKS